MKSLVVKPRALRAFAVLIGVLLCFAALSASAAPAFADDGDSLAAGSGAQLSSASNDVTPVRAKVTIDKAAGHSLLGMVNAARAQRGLSGYAWDSRLERAAIQRAVEIMVRYDGSHTRPDGSPWSNVYPDGSSGFTSRGENIAAMYSSADSVNTGWTNSPGHYANMTSSGYNCMAAACAVGANGTKYWVESFGRCGNPDWAYVSDLEVGSSYTATVNVLPSLVTLKITGPDEILKGQLGRYGARIGDADVFPCVTWRTPNTSTIGWGSDGSVLSVFGYKEGTATLNACVWESRELVASKTVKVLSYDLANATVTYEGSDYDYWNWSTNQYEHKLPFSKASTCPTTTVSCNGSTLVRDVDYTLSYQIDHAQALGIITLNGLGKYAGTSKTVSIGIIPVNINSVGINAQIPAYTGKPIRLNLAVSYAGSTDFKEGVDYTVTYNNNVNAGTAGLTLVGMGLLKGTFNGTFTIPKAANTLKVKAKKASVKYSKKAKRTLARKKYLTVSKAVGKLTYGKVSGNSKISVARNGKITVKKKLKRGTYKVRVRVTAAGNANYNAKSTTVTARITVT